MRVDVTISEPDDTNYGVEVSADGAGPVQVTLRATRTYVAPLTADEARRMARALEFAAEAAPADPGV